MKNKIKELASVTSHAIASECKKSGEAGRRSQCLSHAKRALYHLSYIPISFRFSKLLKTFRQEISQSFIKTHLS